MCLLFWEQSWVRVDQRHTSPGHRPGQRASRSPDYWDNGAWMPRCMLWLPYRMLWNNKLFLLLRIESCFQGRWKSVRTSPIQRGAMLVPAPSLHAVRGWRGSRIWCEEERVSPDSIPESVLEILLRGWVPDLLDYCGTIHAFPLECCVFCVGLDWVGIARVLLHLLYHWQPVSKLPLRPPS